MTRQADLALGAAIVPAMTLLREGQRVDRAVEPVPSRAADSRAFQRPVS
jgi:hypothetical protein